MLFSENSSPFCKFLDGCYCMFDLCIALEAQNKENVMTDERKEVLTHLKKKLKKKCIFHSIIHFQKSKAGLVPKTLADTPTFVVCSGERKKLTTVETEMVSCVGYWANRYVEIYG